MRILIVDDEALARARLHSLIEDLQAGEVVAEAANGREALEIAVAEAPDVVLLDIRMPGMDGIEAAGHLSKLETPPAVIFVTAYDEYALSAFETHAVDYLLKPIRRERLAAALQSATRLTRAQLLSVGSLSGEHPEPTHISARVHGTIKLVPVDDIRYFQAEHKYVTVREGEGEVLIEESLVSLESKFSSRFIRIHRNALVARAYLEALEKDESGRFRVRLRGVPETLEVSRRHLPGLRKCMKGG